MSKGFCCVGLFNPKTPENVGSVLRAAGCYGVNSVFYTGVRYDRAKEFVTDTKKVHQKIPLIGIEDLQHVIPLGCTPVAGPRSQPAQYAIDTAGLSCNEHGLLRQACPASQYSCASSGHRSQERRMTDSAAD